MPAPVRKYHIFTFGCQMNKSDSERIAALLELTGLERAAKETDADVVIMNSCSVRQAAEDRIFGKLRNLGRARAKRPNLIVAVTGCLPGRDKDSAIRAKMPEADLFFPIKDLPQLPRWLAELDPEIATTGDVAGDYLRIRPNYSSKFQAFVPVQTGCQKFCTYCVVPYARGLEANRPAADILAEVADLAERGVIEVTLLGQAINTYKAPDRGSFSAQNPYQDDYAALLWEVNRIPGIRRVNFTGAHPMNMTDEVIDALALPKQINFLHLPIQAGSNEVLKRMNRRYTREQYLEIIRKVRARRPGIALGTDIIVGFCGETPEQFEETLSLYREADFDISYNAMYSTRSGTQAAKLYVDDVPKAEKKRRWNALQAVMEEIVLRKNQAYVGRTVEVLVDQKGDGWCGGNSSELKLVRFPSTADLRGQIVNVKIDKAMEWLLTGKLTNSEAVEQRSGETVKQ
ncbi:MAG: tRNA (N6-isopentenyl adenosine(37)-C2)-methylthiotransferase MiaB [Patescibacteria group bacterium]|jgi:tRNA-2-methylthio-N6-dimethylallyladenosine synthase